LKKEARTKNFLEVQLEGRGEGKNRETVEERMEGS
jgi:hypothetical protein